MQSDQSLHFPLTNLSGDDETFRFNNPSTHEGHLSQTAILTGSKVDCNYMLGIYEYIRLEKLKNQMSYVLL